MSKHNKKQTRSVVPAAWYYMCTDELSIEKIADVADAAGFDVEVWNEAGVAEIEVEEKKSMDIESCELDMGDEFSNNYLADFGARSLFYISYPADIDGKCKLLLKKMIDILGGKMCADTEDFTPEIV